MANTASNTQGDDFTQSLIEQEAKLGGQLFGSVPKGHQREFFCQDKYTWVWRETWQQDGNPQTVEIRYDVRPDGVMKHQEGHPYQLLTRNEAKNLLKAIQLYSQKVGAQYDHLLQSA